jgi:hypothetical protein
MCGIARIQQIFKNIQKSVGGFKKIILVTTFLKERKIKFPYNNYISINIDKLNLQVVQMVI